MDHKHAYLAPVQVEMRNEVDGGGRRLPRNAKSHGGWGQYQSWKVPEGKMNSHHQIDNQCYVDIRKLRVAVNSLIISKAVKLHSDLRNIDVSSSRVVRIWLPTTIQAPTKRIA